MSAEAIAAAPGPQPRCVTVGNVSSDVTPDALKVFFEHVGPVTGVRTLDFDPVTNSKVYRVHFATPAAAAAAVALTGIALLDKPIAVALGETAAPPPPAPAPPLLIPPTTAPPAPAASPASTQTAAVAAAATAPTAAPAAPAPAVSVPDAIAAAKTAAVALAAAPGPSLLPPPVAAAPVAPAQERALAVLLERGMGEWGVAAPALVPRQSAEELARTVFVENLDPRAVARDTLASYFSTCGTVVHVVLTDGADASCCAFIQFHDVESAARAVARSRTVYGRRVIGFAALPSPPVLHHHTPLCLHTHTRMPTQHNRVTMAQVPLPRSSPASLSLEHDPARQERLHAVLMRLCRKVSIAAAAAAGAGTGGGAPPARHRGHRSRSRHAHRRHSRSRSRSRSPSGERHRGRRRSRSTSRSGSSSGSESGSAGAGSDSSWDSDMDAARPAAPAE